MDNFGINAYKTLIKENKGGGSWTHPRYIRHPRTGGINFKSVLNKVKNVSKNVGKKLIKPALSISLDTAKQILTENKSPKEALLSSTKKRTKELKEALTSGLKGAGKKKGGGRVSKKGGGKKGGGNKNKKLNIKGATNQKKIVLQY